MRNKRSREIVLKVFEVFKTEKLTRDEAIFVIEKIKQAFIFDAVLTYIEEGKK